MRPTDPFRAASLDRATSRTSTAPQPLRTVSALFVDGTPGAFSYLYAGPVNAAYPARVPAIPDYTITFPFEQQALQVFAFAPTAQSRTEVEARWVDPRVLLLVDLGDEREIARIELYGNLLLPPVDATTGPLFNFGIPRSLGVAVIETPQHRRDLHQLNHLDVWLTSAGLPFHARYECRDQRGLWGWTTLHLPPTYGRFLLLSFADLPLVYAPEKAPLIGRGIDIQRLVVYPFLEDVVHHPAIEASLISVRQTRFPVPDASAYWNVVGESPAQPDTHQSVAGDPVNSRLPWPSTFAWLPVRGPDTAWTYESDLIAIDTTDLIFLTLTATTDRIPVLDGVRLYRLDPSQISDKSDPKIAPDGALLYDCTIYVTNDREAAFSARLDHPSWRLVSIGRSMSASSEFTVFPFTEPVWARFVRIIVSIRKRPLAVTDAKYARLRLSGVMLSRCRDFVLTPQVDEDIEVESVLLRLRGKKLLDDYAYIDGESGISITIEARREGGPFQEIRSIRTLLDLIENTSARVFSNPRFPEKPIQLYKEHVESSQSGSSRMDTTDSATTTHSKLAPGYRNVTVSRTGSTTQHVANAKDRLLQLGDPGVAAFPDQDATGVQTKRIYQGLPPALPDPTQVTDAAAFVQFITELINDASNAPIPINFGVGVSGSLGAQAVFGGGGGISFSAGGSVGGGNTRSVVRGRQASVADSQTTTQHMESHQLAKSAGYAVQTRSGTATEDRTVHREDLSTETRRSGTAIQYGGEYEDVILVTIPVRRTLSGLSCSAPAADVPPTTGDMLRVRVDHVPQGVTLDVEFRGAVVPRRGA